VVSFPGILKPLNTITIRDYMYVINPTEENFNFEVTKKSFFYSIKVTEDVFGLSDKQKVILIMCDDI
jgi:hypothetical protein